MTSRAGKGGFENWQELRDHLIDAYTETPHPSTEQEIIDAYELHPDAVTKAALALIDAPDIRSRWAVLKKRAADISTAPSNPARNTSLDKERSIARAEQWVRAAGIHIDRPDEILDELFGDGGQLRAFAQVDLESTTGPDGRPLWKQSEPRGDTALATRILDLWADHRPTGMAIERAADARAAKWIIDQKRLAEMRAEALAQLDQQQTHIRPLPDNDYSATEDAEIPF